MAGLEIVLSAAIDMFRLIGKHDGRVEMPPTNNPITAFVIVRRVQEVVSDFTNASKEFELRN